MNNNIPKKILIIIAFILLLASIISSTASWAQDWTRKGKAEAFGFLQIMDGEENEWFPTVDVEIDQTTVGGVGAGYNFNPYLNLNLSFWFGTIDMESNPNPIFFGLGSPSPAQGDADIQALDLNLDWNMLESRFTPILTFGIGFISFDGDWGTSRSEFSETEFSFNFGGGFRWDITDHFFIKSIVKLTETELDYVDERISLASISLNLGFMF